MSRSVKTYNKTYQSNVLIINWTQ